MRERKWKKQETNKQYLRRLRKLVYLKDRSNKDFHLKLKSENQGRVTPSRSI
jgi:hypothetical protein